MSLCSGFFPKRGAYKKITFGLGNGKDLVVTGENVGGKNIYVQSARWQGKEHNECKLTHSQILEGGRLHFVMGDKPSEWAKINYYTKRR